MVVEDSFSLSHIRNVLKQRLKRTSIGNYSLDRVLSMLSFGELGTCLSLSGPELWSKLLLNRTTPLINSVSTHGLSPIQVPYLGRTLQSAS